MRHRGLCVIGDVDAEREQLRSLSYMRSLSQSSENTCKNIFFIGMLRNFIQADECVYVMEKAISYLVSPVKWAPVKQKNGRV